MEEHESTTGLFLIASLTLVLFPSDPLSQMESLQTVEGV